MSGSNIAGYVAFMFSIAPDVTSKEIDEIWEEIRETQLPLKPSEVAHKLTDHLEAHRRKSGKLW